MGVVVKTCLEESFGKCLVAAWGQGWWLVVLVGVVGVLLWLAWPYVGGWRKAGEEQGKRDAERAKDAVKRPEIRRRYLESFIEDHKHFKFRGLNAQARGLHTPEIDEAFVSLRLVPEAAEDETASPKGTRPAAEPRLGLEQAEPIELADAVGRSPRLAIIGAAGCGKSTLLQWAGLAVARAGLHKTLRAAEQEFVAALGGRELTPVLVSLAAFNQHCKNNKLPPSPQTFLSFVAASAEQAHPSQRFTREFFEEELRRGCLLMLDGLDEVDPDDREAVRGVVEGLLGDLRETTGNRYFLTARSVAYRGRAEVADFRKCVVQPLAPAQRESLLGGWYSAIYPDNRDLARRQAADLCGRIDRSDDRVRALAVTPLMVTIFALVHFDRRELPRQRAELYEHAVQILLTERFKPEDVVNALKRVGGLEWQTRRDRLARIAFELHALREKGDSVAEDDLVGLIWLAFGAEEKAARETALQFVRVIADRGGLLEETGRRYGFFTHRTFREFLAGRYLAEELEPEPRRVFLAEHIADDHWEEPIRLAAGYLAINGENRANELIRIIAGIGTGPGERAQALTLAGLALSDLPAANVQAATVDAVKPAMREIFEANPPHVEPALRRRVGLALGAIGDPRFSPGGEPVVVPVPSGRFRMGTSRADTDRLKAQGVEPWDDEQAEDLEVFVSDFSVGKFPVTNVEFRAFWDPEGANGYGRRDYWTEEGWRWRRGEEEEPDLSFISDDDVRRRYRGWLAQRPAGRRDRPYFWDRPELNGDNQPVTGVTWYEADAYCRWLSVVTGGPYRLPTEAEWEKAARGVDGRLWPWGNEWDAAKCNSADAKFGGTTPVGLYPDGASPCGALDMAGNVWEWCSDWWAADVYRERQGRELNDPGGPALGAARVVRGGAWDAGRRGCRAACRFRDDPVALLDSVGFRVVRAAGS